MKIFSYVDEKAKKYGNNYQPLKDSILIIISNFLILLLIAFISFFLNNEKVLLIGLLLDCVIVILEVINFTSKRNIDLSCLILKEGKLLIIKVNPLVKKKDLDILITNYNKENLKKNKELVLLLKDENFINYLLKNSSNIYQFEIVEIADIYQKKLTNKKIEITCDLYNLRYKVIKKNCKITILNAYTRQTEIYKYIKDYNNKTIYKIDKENEEKLKEAYKKNISDFKFWLITSFVFYLFIIIFKIIIPYIVTIPFYALTITFVLVLSCYDRTVDTNYGGSKEPQIYIKLAIALFMISLLSII